MDFIAEWFANTLGNYMSSEFVVFFISMIPILELRGGILVARMLDIPMWQAIIACVIGNIIPIPFILLFIKKIFSWLKPVKFIGKIIEKLEARAMNKSDNIKKMEFWGLMLFVGIPLPGTGAWTGALIASLLDIDIKKSSLAILLGITLATIIMCLISYGVLGGIINYFS